MRYIIADYIQTLKCASLYTLHRSGILCHICVYMNTTTRLEIELAVPIFPSEMFVIIAHTRLTSTLIKRRIPKRSPI